MPFVYGSFPRRIRMSKETVRAPLLNVCKIFKLRAVISGYCFEDGTELAAILALQLLHSIHHSFFGFSGDVNGKIMARDAFSQRQNDSFFAIALANYCVGPILIK